MSRMKRAVNRIWERKLVMIPVAVMLVLAVVLGVGYIYTKQAKATTYTSKSEIPSEKEINGTVYTKDRPYKIIEVVPTGGTAQGTWGWCVGGTSMGISIEDLDYLYHVVGGTAYSCAFTDGEHNDQGVCRWTGVTVAGAGADKLKSVEESMMAALADTYVASFSVNNWQVTGRNLQVNSTGNYGNPTDWSKSTFGTGGWLGDYFYPNGDGTFTKVQDRNFLAHALFENKPVSNSLTGFSDMSDKLVVETVEVDKLTKDIIDGADMVYLNSKVHNSNVLNANNKFVELCNANGIGSGGTTAGLTRTYSTATAKDGLDNMTDTIAMYLYMQSVTNDLPIAVDWSTRTTGSAFHKFLCAALGIESDTFVSEYAYKKVGTDSYIGTNGKTYINSSGKWVIEQDGYGILTWDDWMFIGSHGNVQQYPYFNATAGIGETMHKNIYAFQGTNALDMKLINDYAAMAEDERNDAKDAKDVFKDDDLLIRNCIQYIMGLFGNGDKADVYVAEIQPWGKFRYNSEEGARKILKMFGVSNSIVRLVTEPYTESGVSNDVYTVYELQTYILVAGVEFPDKKFNIKIRSMSMNAFNGITEDLASTFDLIILDSYDPDSYISLTSGSYNTNAQYVGSVNVGKAGKTERTMSGNDLTEKMAERLYDYVSRGMPFFMSREIYYGDVDTIDASCVNLKQFCWSNLNKRLKSENKLTHNIATVGGLIDGTGDPVAANFKSTTNLTFGDKVNFEISTPTAYRQQDTSSLYSPADVKFSIKLNSYLPAGSTVKLYVDRNADALYNDDDSSALRELYATINVTSDTSTGIFSIPLDISDGKLPDTWFGYFKFKVEITTKDGIKSSQESAFALKPNKERTVYALQVYNDKNGGGYDDTTACTLRMTSGSIFDDAFTAIYDVTNMKLSVDVMSTTEFTTAVKENPDYLRPYSIVIMGFCDSYGKEGNPLTDQDVIDVLKDYVDENKSILFTHDCMTYNYSSSSDTLTENNMTQQMTVPIGMQGSGKLTNRLLMRLGGGFMSTFKDIAKSNGTKTTTKVDKLNWGQITEYPYEISSSISVGTTHEQFYRLNLEKIDTYDDDTGAVMSGVYNSYVTTWFTLGDDGSSSESNYYSLTGQDAINNYYVYSKGNITYTSAGHSSLDAEGSITDEMRLFVNTLVRSIIVSVDPPTVEVTNGALVDTDEYEIIGRPGFYSEDGTWNSTTTSTEEGVAGTWNPSSGIPLQFIVKDSIMAAGYPFAKGSLYVDINDNGKYDSGTDYLLKEYGYGELLNETEVTEDIAALAQAAGCIDVVGNLYTSNQLKIGIKAENTVKTSGQAYARYIRRKYFDLG